VQLSDNEIVNFNVNLVNLNCVADNKMSTVVDTVNISALTNDLKVEKDLADFLLNMDNEFDNFLETMKNEFNNFLKSNHDVYVAKHMPQLVNDVTVDIEFVSARVSNDNCEAQCDNFINTYGIEQSLVSKPLLQGE